MVNGSHRKPRPCIAFALLLVGVAGCGSSHEHTTAGGNTPYPSEQFEKLREPAARLIPADWTSLANVIPADGEPAKAEFGGELFVVGEVTNVRVGSSYYWIVGENGPIEQVPVDAGDPRAAIDTAIVELAAAAGADEKGESLAKNAPVSFGLSFLPGVSIKQVESDLRSHDQLAVILVRANAFPGNPAAWDVLGDGDFLGVVDNGLIAFPLLESGLYPKGFVANDIPLESVIPPVA